MSLLVLCVLVLGNYSFGGLLGDSDGMVYYVIILSKFGVNLVTFVAVLTSSPPSSRVSV